MVESENLKNLRDILRLSQTEFAASIGLKQGQYSKIERGASSLTNEAAGQIMTVYNVNPYWWFFGEKPMFTTDQKSTYEMSENEWKDKYYRVLEENSILYKKLYKEEEEKNKNLGKE